MKVYFAILLEGEKREESRKSKNNFISSNSNSFIIKFNAEKWNNQKYSKYN